MPRRGGRSRHRDAVADEALQRADRQPLWKRLGWLALLWAASVLTLSLAGALLRAWLAP